jgi:EmrB/QacA subfamily drug resistance transporter
MANAAGPKNMGRVMGLVAVPMMLAPMLGPLLGGTIIQTLNWHWIFFVNIFVGAIALPLAIKVLPKKAGERTDRLDVVGLSLMSTGLVGITFGLAETGTLGTFNSSRVYLPILLGVGLVIAFAFHALRVAHPLLDLRLYKRWHFTAASIVMFTLGAAVFGAMILMPLYWQDLRGYDVIHTGLLTGPQGLGMALMMPVASRLTQRYGGGPVALGGVLVTAVMTIPFALIGAHTNVLFLCVAMVLRGTGMGASFMPAMTAAFAALDRSEVSHATPQLNVLNRIGGSIGTTLLAVVLERSLLHAHTLAQRAHSYGTAFSWSVGLAVIALVPCVVLMRAEANARKSAREVGLMHPDEVASEAGAVAEALA